MNARKYKMNQTAKLGAAALTLMFPTFASALQPPMGEELSQVASCREIPKAKARLKCFDRTTQFLDGPIAPVEEALAGKAQLLTQNAPDGDQDRIAGFGAEDLVIEDRDGPLKELRAIATSITRDARGKYSVELENGQIWRQLQGDGNTLRVRKDKSGKGHNVIIKKRSLGAYALRMTTAKRSILVRRVR